jgi:hypothetical protein
VWSLFQIFDLSKSATILKRNKKKKVPDSTPFYSSSSLWFLFLFFFVLFFFANFVTYLSSVSIVFVSDFGLFIAIIEIYFNFKEKQEGKGTLFFPPFFFFVFVVSVSFLFFFFCLQILLIHFFGVEFADGQKFYQLSRMELWGFFTPPVARVDFWAVFVAKCFLRTLPPVDL